MNTQNLLKYLKEKYWLANNNTFIYIIPKMMWCSYWTHWKDPLDHWFWWNRRRIGCRWVAILVEVKKRDHRQSNNGVGSRRGRSLCSSSSQRCWLGLRWGLWVLNYDAEEQRLTYTLKQQHLHGTVYPK